MSTSVVAHYFYAYGNEDWRDYDCVIMHNLWPNAGLLSLLHVPCYVLCHDRWLWLHATWFHSALSIWVNVCIHSELLTSEISSASTCTHLVLKWQGSILHFIPSEPSICHLIPKLLPCVYSCHVSVLWFKCNQHSYGAWNCQLSMSCMHFSCVENFFLYLKTSCGYLMDLGSSVPPWLPPVCIHNLCLIVPTF